MKLELFFLFLLLLIFPFGQLTKLPLNLAEINIYFHDLLVVFLLLSWGLRKVFTKEKFIWPSLTKPILAFIITAGFSLVLILPYHQSREVMVGFLYLLRWISYAGIYFALTDLLKDRRFIKLKLKIYDLLVIVTAVGAILGLLQYIFIPNIRPLTAFDWDPHYYRVVGTYLDPGFTGLIYVLGLILIAVKLWGKTRIKKYSQEKLIYQISFILIYLALALTYSRSAYLAYLLAMAIIAWSKKSIKFFLTALFLGIITIALLPRPGGEGVKLERQSTISARINNWKQTLKIGWDKPVFGVGFNTYRYVQRDYGILPLNNWQQTHAGAGADSSLLFIFATTGVVGLMSYLWLIAKILTSAYKNKSLVVLASLTSLLIHSCFNNSLFYAWIMLWWWILLGIRAKNQGV